MGNEKKDRGREERCGGVYVEEWKNEESEMD